MNGRTYYRRKNAITDDPLNLWLKDTNHTRQFDTVWVRQGDMLFRGSRRQHAIMRPVFGIDIEQAKLLFPKEEFVYGIEMANLKDDRYARYAHYSDWLNEKGYSDERGVRHDHGPKARPISKPDADSHPLTKRVYQPYINKKRAATKRHNEANRSPYLSVDKQIAEKYRNDRATYHPQLSSQMKSTDDGRPSTKNEGTFILPTTYDEQQFMARLTAAAQGGSTIKIGDTEVYATDVLNRISEQDDYWRGMAFAGLDRGDRLNFIRAEGFDPAYENNPVSKASLDNYYEYFREQPVARFIPHATQRDLIKQLANAIVEDRMSGQNVLEEEVMASVQDLYSPREYALPRPGSPTTTQLRTHFRGKTIAADYSTFEGIEGVQFAGRPMDTDTMQRHTKGFMPNVVNIMQQLRTIELKEKLLYDTGFGKKEIMSNRINPEIQKQLNKLEAFYEFSHKYGELDKVVYGYDRSKESNYWQEHSAPSTFNSGFFDYNRFATRYPEFEPRGKVRYDSQFTANSVIFYPGLSGTGTTNADVAMQNSYFSRDLKKLTESVHRELIAGRTPYVVQTVTSRGRFTDAYVVNMHEGVTLTLDNFKREMPKILLDSMKVGVKPIVAAVEDYAQTCEKILDTYTGKLTSKRMVWPQARFVNPYDENSTVYSSRLIPRRENSMGNMKVKTRSGTGWNTWLALDFTDPRWNQDRATQHRAMLSKQYRRDYYHYDQKLFGEIDKNSPKVYHRKTDITSQRHIIFSTELKSMRASMAAGGVNDLESLSALMQKGLSDVPAPRGFLDERGNLTYNPSLLVTRQAFDTYMAEARRTVGIVEHGKLLRQKYLYTQELRKLGVLPEDLLNHMEYELVKRLDKVLAGMPIDRMVVPWAGIEVYDPNDPLHENPLVHYPKADWRFNSYNHRYDSRASDTFPLRHGNIPIRDKLNGQGPREFINWNADKESVSRAERFSANIFGSDNTIAYGERRGENLPLHVFTNRDVIDSFQIGAAQSAMQRGFDEYSKTFEGMKLHGGKDALAERLKREEAWNKKTNEAKDYVAANYPRLYALYTKSYSEEYGSYSHDIIVEFMRELHTIDIKHNKQLLRMRASLDRLDAADARRDSQLSDRNLRNALNVYYIEERKKYERMQRALRQREKALDRAIARQRSRGSGDDYDEGFDGDDADDYIPRPARIETAGKQFTNDFQNRVVQMATARVQAPWLGKWDIISHWMPTLNDLIWAFVPPSKYYGYMMLASNMQWMMKSQFDQRQMEIYLGAMARGRAGLTKKPYRRDFRKMIWTTTWSEA